MLTSPFYNIHDVLSEDYIEHQLSYSHASVSTWCSDCVALK